MTEASAHPQATRTVLVVDDEPAFRTLVRRLLTAAGYVAIEAANGRQAIEVVGTTHVDLVITDLAMPELEGLETIRILRQEYPEPKIIAVSGRFGGDFLAMATALGARASLAKPFLPDALLDTVRQVLAAP